MGLGAPTTGAGAGLGVVVTFGAETLVTGTEASDPTCPPEDKLGPVGAGLETGVASTGVWVDLGAVRCGVGGAGGAAGGEGEDLAVLINVIF